MLSRYKLKAFSELHFHPNNRNLLILLINPFRPKSDLIDFTLSNTSVAYLQFLCDARTPGHVNSVVSDTNELMYHGLVGPLELKWHPHSQ